ncbi:diguanylate cyclase [Bacillus mangrovi]|uniref:Diguanylate cyclase n=1 Tax=Metabacillus mangrovi TaxID=1491830 RepID=A0A7X2S6V7_9BACI|nr:GGDEF domain-containing protein [Metabacillus mangrovi]MTH54368.1 diguanylate cyclase [Metabacillus mangrovi]
MKTLYIGDQDIGAAEMDWPFAIQTAASLKAVSESAQRVDAVLLSEKIWYREKPESLLMLKKRVLKENGRMITLLESESPEKIDRLYNAGIDDYIVEPLTRSKLLFRLHKKEPNEHAERHKLLSMIKNLKEANEKLRNLSNRDPLTELYNRRYFYTYLSEIRLEDLRGLSIVMADLDSFKVYNDRFGHLTGDECLKLTAGRIRDIADKFGAVAARYGGEEFIAVIKNRSDTYVSEMAEEIRRAVADIRMNANGSRIPGVTISIGTARGTPVKIEDCHQLIGQADEALYKAKELGGNQVSVFQPEERLTVLDIR